MELTPSFVAILQDFQVGFTVPSFQTFVLLVSGWCLSHRHRFGTELIQSSGSAHNGHHSCYHRFFSHAAWSLGVLSHVLAGLLVRLFVPSGILELAVDDTLGRKRGLTVYGTGMHHDPLISSRAKPLVRWGHDWVVLCLILRSPSWAPTKVWCLPVLFRLYKNRQGLTKGKKGQKKPPDPNHRTRPELAVAMITRFAAWFPERQCLVSRDSAYGGKSVLRRLPANVDLLSHVHPKGAWYAPPPPRQPHQKGAGRKKGARLPGMAAWAADASQAWQTLVFHQFGLHATLLVKTIQALYYKAGKGRLLTIRLTRDARGKRPDQMFYCTRLDQVGHACLRFPDRPWYQKKVEPSFADLLTTLRRVTWEERFANRSPTSAGYENSLALLLEFVSRTG